MGPGVLAYCRHVAGSANALPAAAEALSRFRIALIAEEQINEAKMLRLLHAATRSAATQRGVNVIAARGRSDIGGCIGPETEVLRHVEGSLSRSQHERVEAHLRQCGLCADAQRRLTAGERALVGPPIGALAPDVIQALVDALVMAAPVQAEGESQTSVPEAAPVVQISTPELTNDPEASPAQDVGPWPQPERAGAAPAAIENWTETSSKQSSPTRSGEGVGAMPPAIDAGRPDRRFTARRSRPLHVARRMRTPKMLLRGTTRMLAVVIAAGGAGTLLGAGLAKLSSSDNAPPAPLAGGDRTGGPDGTARATAGTRLQVKVVSAIAHPVTGAASGGAQRVRLGVHLRVENVNGRTVPSSPPVLLVGEDRVEVAPESTDAAKSLLADLRSDGVADETLRFDIAGATARGLTQGDARLRVFDVSVALKPKPGSPVAPA